MDTRARLIKAAARLFAEHGFDGVSVRDIVREARVNLAAITYHFGSKEQLLEAVIMEKVEPLKQAGMKIAMAKLSPKDKLATLLRNFAHQMLCRDPDLRVLFAESVRNTKTPSRQALEDMRSRNVMVAGIIKEGIANGSFRKCDVDGTVWIFLGILMPYVVHQSMMEKATGRKRLSEQFVNKFVDNALSILFDGLASKKGSAK
jgi:AcrR family transcriptional regulator